MISSLKQISFKFFKSNKKITYSCIAVIAIVTFLMGSLINFVLNSNRITEEQKKEIFGDFQLQVGYSNNIDNNIDENFVNEINSMKGVTKTSLAIVSNLEVNGEITYTLGLESDELSKSKYHYSKNLDDNSAIVNEALAEYMNIFVGDSIRVNNVEKEVIEVFDDRINSGSPINMLILDRETLKEMAGIDKEATFICIRADKKQVKDIAEKLSNKDENIRVEIPEESEFANKNFNSLRYFIIFIGVLVFIMCGLFVVSNMQQFVYKYTKDFAIMKAIGADVDQIAKIVFYQTILINIIGVLSGIMLTILSVVFFLKEFTINFVPILKISFMGFVICQVILFIPAIRTAKILPIKAIQQNEKVNMLKKRKRKNRYISGLIVIGIAFVAASMILRDSKSFLEGIVGYLIILIGCFLLFINNVVKIVDVISKVAEKGFSIPVQLAVKTIKSQLRKNSIIIVAVSMVMIIVVVGGSFIEVVRKNSNDYYRNEYLSDIELETNGFFPYSDAEEIVSRINKLDNTDTIEYYHFGDVCYYNKSKEENIYCSMVDIDKMYKSKLIENSTDNKSNKVILNEEFAKEENLNKGDYISIKTPEYNGSIGDRKRYNLKFEIIDIVNPTIARGNKILIDKTNYEKMSSSDIYLDKIFINSQNEGIKDELKDIKSRYPSIKWSSLDEVLKANDEALTVRWRYFNMALIVIVITTIFGMVSAIKNNINSNRKEYALLRSMKFTDKDLKKMLIYQVVIFLVMGKTMGFVLGTIGAWIIACSDKFMMVPFNYKLVGLDIIVSIMICILYLAPFILKISKERIIHELNQEEL